MFVQSMAYMISGNMDRGVEEFQLEAAISKIYGSVSGSLADLSVCLSVSVLIMCATGSCLECC